MDEDSCPVGLHHMLVLYDCYKFRNGEGNWRHCWYSAAPTHHLQNLSSHGQCDCHWSIKLVHSWFLQMTGQSGQCINTLICLVELPHHRGLPSPMLLPSWGPQRFMWHRASYCLCIGRGRRAMNDVQIFIWVPPQGALTVQDCKSLILQALVHKFKNGEHCHCWFMCSVMQSTK